MKWLSLFRLGFSHTCTRKTFFQKISAKSEKLSSFLFTKKKLYIVKADFLRA